MYQIDPAKKKLRGSEIHGIVDTRKAPPPDQHVFYAYQDRQTYHLRDHQANMVESK